MAGFQARDQAFESWGAMLESYQRERTQIPWDPSKVEPVQYRTHAQITREQREFNPVLQRYTDATKDASVAERRERDALRTMNRARDHELRFSQRYDVVNHLPRVADPSAAGEADAKAKVPDTRTGYDIIHHGDNRSKPCDDFVQQPRAEGKRALAHKAARDFDIISNRYVVDDAGRSAADAEARRTYLSRKYWQTHGFDPVRGALVDGREEEAFRRRREEAQRVHASREPAATMPPSYQVGESAAFNPITAEVRSEARMRDYARAHLRRPMDPKRYAFEKGKLEEGERAAGVAETRSINRVAHKRFVASVAHGFDIVTHEKLRGRGAKPVPQPRARPRAGPWDTLQQSAAHAPSSRLVTASSGVLQREDRAPAPPAAPAPAPAAAEAAVRATAGPAERGRSTVPPLHLGGGGGGGGGREGGGGWGGGGSSVRTSGFA